MTQPDAAADAPELAKFDVSSWFGIFLPKAAPAQKQAAAQPGQPADIGDICLLPDIARFAH